MKIRLLDKIVFGTLKFIEKNKKGIITLCSGFLLGRIVNEFSYDSRTFTQVISGLFSIVQQPTNFLSWICAITIPILPILQKALDRYHTKKQYYQIFMSILKKSKSLTIENFPGLGWKEALSLQTCPNLHQGWLPKQIKIQHDTARFTLPDGERQPYNEYFKNNYNNKRFFDDGDKIMLSHNPISFTDSPTLLLSTKETKYSEIQYYKDNLAKLEEFRMECIAKAVTDESREIVFPNAFCMQLIVETKDERILITKRSPKVSYSPNTWQCSIAEQASPEDFQNRQDVILNYWTERLLDEELNVHAGDYNQDNLRILSVFLEGDILNAALCAHLVLNLSSWELNKRLLILPRKDDEFIEWEFLSYNQLFGELIVHSQRHYHPSSQYCMLLGLIKKWGPPVMAEKLLNFV